MRTYKGWVMGLLLAATGAVMAGSTTQVDAPPAPAALQSGESLEPEVTIREGSKGKVYEYRINGKLVMVRVKPRVGPPYFFVDSDGDGNLEYTVDDPTQGPNVNQWVIFRWD